MSIQEDMALVLGQLAGMDSRDDIMNQALADPLGMSPDRVNDAVRLLEEYGYVRAMRVMGTAPFDFYYVGITPRGRLEWEHASARSEEPSSSGPLTAVRPTPQPVGSPFGFSDQDWEWVGAERIAKTLKVVFGHQFTSEYYVTDALVGVLETQFRAALADSVFGAQLELDFVPLRAGYGEHIFNQIARSIIASDIAVFDTSDSNPNVMIEMGVALTWGTRVHPIRDARSPQPPSDISGQTWATYHDSGQVWDDPNHARALLQMVERAARKKLAQQ